MYGYIRPDRGALTVLEYRRFQAAYCGLCEALQKRCGALARFVVSYDLTFLAMVLSRGACTEWRRCPAHPLQKRPCAVDDPALDAAADYSVILSRWKLRDTVTDESLAVGLPSRSALALLRPAYEKAAERQTAFDENTRACLQELSALEEERCPSLDRAADCFARILAFAADGEESERRIRREILYHVGRCVYILDAVDDFEQDRKDGSYNPLLCRREQPGDKLTREEKEELRSTLILSQRCAAKALELRQEDVWQPILRNILCLGLPQAMNAVLAGKWNKRDRQTRYPEILKQEEELK